CDDEPDAVTGKERLELVDVARKERALGEDDDLDGTLLVPRRLEDPVSQVQVQQLAWCELKEAMRLDLGALNHPDRLEVLRVHAQRPRKQQHVPVLCRAGASDADVA